MSKNNAFSALKFSNVVILDLRKKCSSFNEIFFVDKVVSMPDNLICLTGRPKFRMSCLHYSSHQVGLSLSLTHSLSSSLSQYHSFWPSHSFLSLSFLFLLPIFTTSAFLLLLIQRRLWRQLSDWWLNGKFKPRVTHFIKLWKKPNFYYTKKCLC